MNEKNETSIEMTETMQGHEEAPKVQEPDAAPAPVNEEAAATVPAEPEAEQAEAAQQTRRRTARETVRLKKTIATANDMVEVETPEDRRAKDIDEIRRAIKQERILTAKVDGVEPFDGDNARIIGHRNSLKRFPIPWQAQASFHAAAAALCAPDIPVYTPA